MHPIRLLGSFIIGVTSTILIPSIWWAMLTGFVAVILWCLIMDFVVKDDE